MQVIHIYLAFLNFENFLLVLGKELPEAVDNVKLFTINVGFRVALHPR
jgi:hypothetical protein